jgi:NADH:ubiquinone reductase (non-electrogenic)
MAVGAEVQTFGIPGVTEHACFMKELNDAEKVGWLLVGLMSKNSQPCQMQRHFMDCQ